MYIFIFYILIYRYIGTAIAESERERKQGLGGKGQRRRNKNTWKRGAKKNGLPLNAHGTAYARSVIRLDILTTASKNPRAFVEQVEKFHFITLIRTRTAVGFDNRQLVGKIVFD